MCNEVLQRKSTFGDKVHYVGVVTFYGLLNLVMAFFYIPLTIIITPIFPAFTKRYLWLTTKMTACVTGLHADLEDADKLKCIPKGVIVMNHQSVWDFFMVCSMYDYMGDIVHTVSRKEVFYMWPLGLGMWLSGSIFIDRSSPATALNQLISESRKICAPSNPKRSKIIIFPEGSRNKKMNGFQQFKRGAFKVAAANNVPIIPIVCPPQTFRRHLEFFRPGTDGGVQLFAELIEGSQSTLLIREANVVLKCLDPVMIDPEKDLDHQIEIIRSKMLTEYHKMMDAAGIRREDD